MTDPSSQDSLQQFIDEENARKKAEHQRFVSTTALSTCLVLFALGLIGWWSDWSAGKKAAEYYAKAQDELRAENYPQALHNLDYAIKNKELPLYYYIKYQVLTDYLDKPYEAQVTLQKAIDRGSKNPVYHNAAGELQMAMGNFEDAVPHFKAATALAPRNSDYRLNLASAYMNMSDYPQSIKTYQAILKQDPNFELAWHHLATAHEYHEDLKSALKVRREATRKFPQNAFQWYWLAVTLDKDKQIAEAVKTYKKSILLDTETGEQAALRIKELTGEEVDQRYFHPKIDKIPVDTRGNRVITAVTIDEDYPAELVVDTGATNTILYERFLKRAGFSHPSGAAVAQFQTVNGIIQAPLVYVDLQLGHQHFHNVRVAIVPSPEKDASDGLLGMDVLKAFDVEIDQRQSLLILKP